MEPLTPAKVAELLINSGLTVAGSLVVAWIASAVLHGAANRLAAIRRVESHQTSAAALRPSVCWGILLFGGYEAFLLWPWHDTVLSIGAHVSLALATLLGVLAAVRLINVAVRWYTSRENTVHAHDIVGILAKSAIATVWIVGLLLTLDLFGYKIGPLLASLGIAGAAIALGLQDTLSSLFAGVYLMIDRPIVPGDFVRIDGGHEGIVERIGWRNTWLHSCDGRPIVVPNVTLAKSVISNLAAPDARRVEITSRVANGTEINRLENLCLEVTAGLDRFLESEYPTEFRVIDVGGAGIGFSLAARARENVDRLDAESELRKAIYRRLSEEGIQLA